MVKLIDNWRHAHRFSSMWLMALAVVFEGLQALLDLVGWRFMSSGWQTAVSIGLVLAAMVARLVAQAPAKGAMK